MKLTDILLIATISLCVYGAIAPDDAMGLIDHTAAKVAALFR